MEGPVKERLTGALILIAALVIVVPEMLSGPDVATSSQAQQGGEAGPPVRTYELQLDTPAATRSEDQSALSPQSATSQAATSQATTPAPAAAASPAASAPAAPLAAKPSTEKAAVEKPVPVPVPVAAEPPAPATAMATGGNWWVQLGSFSARENAERLGKQLRAAGYPISVSPIKSNGKELYRVRAGPVASREAAAGLQGRLAAAGHKSSLVAP